MPPVGIQQGMPVGAPVVQGPRRSGGEMSLGLGFYNHRSWWYDDLEN